MSRTLINSRTVKSIDWTLVMKSVSGANPVPYVRVTLYDGSEVFISGSITNDLFSESKRMMEEIKEIRSSSNGKGKQGEDGKT